MSNLRIFVLTLNPDFAKSELFQYLSQLCNDGVVIVPGFEPSDFGCLVDCTVHGSPGKPSCIEFAIAEGHRKSRNIARKFNSDLNLFLEDDAMPLAQVDAFRMFISSFEDISTLRGFTALHLFPEQNGILRRIGSPNFLGVLSLPDYAVAYLMSQRALTMLTIPDQSVSTDVADWPIFIRDLQWLATKESIFAHPDISKSHVRSSTRESRTSKLDSISFRKKVRQFRFYYKYLFKILRIFGDDFGYSPIESEKIRTVVI